MIDFLTIDILDVKRNAIIIHGVNCLGKMGRGLALDIRDKYPSIYYDHKEVCAKNNPTDLLGSAYLYKVNDDDLYIVNLFSQKFISRTEPVADKNAIRRGLETVFEYIDGAEWYEDIQVFMPKIGCVNGGLNWDTDVYPMIVELDSQYDKRIQINVCQHPKK